MPDRRPPQFSLIARAKSSWHERKFAISRDLTRARFALYHRECQVQQHLRNASPYVHLSPHYNQLRNRLYNRATINNILYRRRYHCRCHSPRRLYLLLLRVARRIVMMALITPLWIRLSLERMAMGLRAVKGWEKWPRALRAPPYRRDNRYLFIIVVTVVGARFIGSCSSHADID